VRLLRYGINVTLDGCCDHTAGVPDEELHRFWADVGAAVQRLKDQPGEAIHLGGVTLPRALADLGLIDEYVFVVHPIVAGRSPTLFAGLQEPIDLELVDRQALASGATVQRYRPRRRTD